MNSIWHLTISWHLTLPPPPFYQTNFCLVTFTGLQPKQAMRIKIHCFGLCPFLLPRIPAIGLSPSSYTQPEETVLCGKLRDPSYSSKTEFLIPIMYNFLALASLLELMASVLLSHQLELLESRDHYLFIIVSLEPSRHTVEAC